MRACNENLKVIILSGFTCSGKDFIRKALVSKGVGKNAKTNTTRKQRSKQDDNYNFKNLKEFYSELEEGNVLEYTDFGDGIIYWSNLNTFEGDGIKIVALDPIGVRKLREMLGDKVLVIHIDCDENIRLDRAIERAIKNKSDLSKKAIIEQFYNRTRKDIKKFKEYIDSEEYDYKIYNNNDSTCIDKIIERISLRVTQ